MNEVHVRSDDWRAIVQVLSGEDRWTFGSTTNGYLDYVCGIPKTRWERREYTLGSCTVMEASLYALEMVGNGTMLENLKSMEVELCVPDVVRVAKVEGRKGLFVASETVDVQGLLRAFKPALERFPQPSAEDEKHMNWILSQGDVESNPRSSAPAPSPVHSYRYVCLYGHVNNEVERDPINDAFFCVECGVEIE